MLSRRLLRIKAVKALYAHLKSESDSLMASEKTLVASIDKTYDLYVQMLSLIVELARYAEQRQEKAKQKKIPTYEDLNPNRKFVDNAAIRLIAESDSVNDYLASHHLSWSAYPELIKTLYQQLEQSSYYKKYMLSEGRSFKEDVALLTNFYTNELIDSEMLENVLDEQSLLWNGDLEYVMSILLRTLTLMRASHSEIKLLPKFKNDDDLIFAKELFAKAAVNFNTNVELIEKFTRNWDIERIAYMDVVIMNTAITELTSFPSIPIKVTFDEYIEISKFYSTANSGVFINGILDKVVVMLTEEGKIAKSGRGLIQ